MIRYALACGQGHEFEAWFSGSADFDDQAGRGLVQCPHCGTAEVRKQIMAPNVATSRKREETQARRAMAEAASKVRAHIKQNFVNVGDRLPAELRAMQSGGAPERAIYGQASAEDAKALKEEGIEIAPLPPMFDPDFDKKLN